MMNLEMQWMLFAMGRPDVLENDRKIFYPTRPESEARRYGNCGYLGD